VKFASRVLGQKELPVENVFLKNAVAVSILGSQRHIYENVNNFNKKNK